MIFDLCSKLIVSAKTSPGLFQGNITLFLFVGLICVSSVVLKSTLDMGEDFAELMASLLIS